MQTSTTLPVMTMMMVVAMMVVAVAVAGADARLEEDKREPTHGDRAQS
jgi:hypothetical protein